MPSTFPRRLLATALIAALPFVVAAQTMQFDAAAIHPSKPAQMNSSIRPSPTGGLLAENATVERLILYAHGVRDYQLTGLPGWAKTEGFDITASLDTPEQPPSKGMTRADLELMFANHQKRVASLLKDRFGLVVREESKDLPVYLLKVSPKGIKMKDASGTPKSPMMRGPRPRELHATSFPMDMFAQSLPRYVDRPVLNETGLTGSYDFDLTWTPDRGPGQAEPAPDTVSAAGSIFTAIQEQLGLKLEAKKAPVKMLVVEKVERPSEN